MSTVSYALKGNEKFNTFKIFLIVVYIIHPALFAAFQQLFLPDPLLHVLLMRITYNLNR